ncbi:Arc family DNA-binding protein [Nitrobacter sp. TKz-YC02]|uniref:Arc family DNA-binding protein n=1 Tax=Nitrobacter sp. TKz-YC02 TaxID=3398704 RepID=UPI003CEE8A32
MRIAIGDDSLQENMAEQYIVRFPEGLRDQIKALAKANRRSMNAEIVFALEERMQAATGVGLRNSAPAAAPINQGIGGA